MEYTTEIIKYESMPNKNYVTVDTNNSTYMFGHTIQFDNVINVDDIENIEIELMHCVITRIPIGVFKIFDLIHHTQTNTVIDIPKKLLFNDETYSGFPVGAFYNFCNIHYFIKSKKILSFTLICENKYNKEEHKAIYNTQLSIPVHLFQQVTINDEKDINLDLRGFCTGFFIETTKLPSRILIKLITCTYFDYDKRTYKFSGDKILKNNGIIVYWIPFMPHRHWNDTNIDAGVNFSRIDKASIHFPENFIGTIYFLTQNDLNIANRCIGLKQYI